MTAAAAAIRSGRACPQMSIVIRDPAYQKWFEDETHQHA
jgi:hypothetical protein